MAPVSAVRLPPGARFNPTDADLVLGYLLPSLRGRGAALDGLLLDADPYAAPPPVLMAIHGRRGEADLFFLSANRAGTGGWRVRGSEAGAAVSVDGEAVAWRKKVLVYCYPEGDGASGAWLMHRFEVSGEGKGQDLVLCRIKKGGGLKKPKKRQELGASNPVPFLGAPHERRSTDAAADEDAVSVDGPSAVLGAWRGIQASPALASGIAPPSSVPPMTQ